MSYLECSHFLRQRSYVFAKVVKRSEPLLNFCGMTCLSVDKPEVDLLHGNASYSEQSQMSSDKLLLNLHGCVFYLIYVKVVPANRFRSICF